MQRSAQSASPSANVEPNTVSSQPLQNFCETTFRNTIYHLHQNDRMVGKVEFSMGERFDFNA